MGSKASIYLRELRKKYGDVFAVREHLVRFYGRDLGDDFEKYVVDYYEAQVLKKEEHKTDGQKKEEGKEVPEKRKVSVGSGIIFFSFLTIFFLVLYLFFKNWWLYGLMSFFLFFAVIFIATPILTPKYPKEEVGGMSMGYGIIASGLAIFIYYMFISRNSWIIFFSSIILWFGWGSMIYSYFTTRMTEKEASSWTTSLSYLLFIPFFALAYFNGANTFLLILYGCIGGLGAILTFYKLGKDMTPDQVFYLLLLLSVSLAYIFIFKTLGGFQWLIAIFLFQLPLLLILRKMGEDSQDDAYYHQFVSWFLIFILCSVSYFLTHLALLLFASGASVLLAIYFLFRHRES